MNDSLSINNSDPTSSGETLDATSPECLSPVGQHPPAEVWIDYFNGALSGEDANGLSRHLSHCRQCIDLILDLDAFAEPSSQSGPTTEFEKAAVWRTVRNVMTSRSPARLRQWPAWAAVAASLCLAVFGLSYWSLQHSELNQLRTQAATFSQAPANAVIASLRPGSRQRGSGGPAAAIAVGEEPKMLVFVLNLIDAVDYPEYEVRVFDSSDTEVARISDLELTDIGNFQLALLPGVLDIGSYDLRLFGLGEGSGRLLETFPIRLQ